MGNWGQAGQGAIGGAAVGTAILPGWGTAIGAGIGGIAGYFSGDNGDSGYQDQLKSLAAGFGQRGGMQAQTVQAQGSGFRQNQAGLIAQLEAMARGDGPSAATTQMRESMDRAAGAQASAAAGAGGRGVNQGAALRNASNNTAAIQAQGARDLGLQRVQEQLGSINSLGQNISSARGADDQMSQFNAGQTNQTNIANMSAHLQLLGLNDKSQLEALMMAMKSAGPGLGTSIMAGGATAAPGLAQAFQSNGQGGSSSGGLAGVPQTGPVTTPGGSSLFGQYSRSDDV
jgi:hypothetical protein